jgi:large subunit ribosomal protein L21e
MVKRTGSTRRKARKRLTKGRRTRGKLSLTRYFASFKTDEKVVLKAEPSVQSGGYPIRFYGKIGVVKGKQGRCYMVSIKDGSKQKTLIVSPVHIERVK